MRTAETKGKPAPAGTPAPEMARPHIPVWLLAGLLVLVTFAIYWPVVGYDFVNYDDPEYVTANPVVQAGLDWYTVKWAFTHPVVGNWHPLTVLSHMLDCQLFGLNPWGHHLVNVLFHALNAALVFLWLRQLTNATWRSLLVAALFSVHPLHVESVAWVAERKDVLSGFFGLLTLIFYARYAQKRSRVEGRGSAAAKAGGASVPASRLVSSLAPPNHALDYFLALVCFALGLMSKPMLVTWPFVLLLLDYWPLGRLRTTDYGLQSSESKNGSQLSTARRGEAERRRLTPLLREKLPFFALAGVISVVTFMAQKDAGIVPTIENLPLGARVGNALISYCRYLGKLFWPTDLAVFYPHPGYWPLVQVLAAGGLILGITVLFIANRRQYPFLLMGWLWFGGTLVPVIQLVQTGGHAMADRYTYLPSLGVLIMAIWGAYELVRRWLYLAIALSVAGLAVIVLCLALTQQQFGYWQDSESLFRHALAVTENNYLAHNNLGDALDRKGQTDEAIRQFQDAIRLKPDFARAYSNLGAALDRKIQTDEAIRQFQEAIRLEPDYALAHYNLGATLDREGRTDEAIRQYQEAIRLKPDGIEAHYNLGIAFGRRNQADEAIRQFQEAIRLKPDYAEARNNLGIVLAARGRFDEAIQNYRQVIQINPNSFEALNNLGTSLAAKGQLDEAIEDYRRAIQINSTRPDTFVHLGMTLEQSGRPREAVTQYQEALKLNPDLAGALNNLAWILATSPDDGLRNGAEAVRFAEHACELTHYSQPLFIGTLAAAYAEAGRFPEAVATAEKAEQLATDAGLTAVAAKNRQLLELYRAGKPYHEPLPTKP